MNSDRFEVLYSYNMGKIPMMRFCRQIWCEGCSDEPRSYEYLKVFRVKSGRAIWEINKQEYNIASGDILLLNNTEPRALRMVLGEEPLVMEYATFLPVAVQCSHKGLTAYFGRNGKFKNLLPRENLLYEKLHELFDLLGMHTVLSLPLNEEMMNAVLNVLFITAAEAFLLSFPMSKEDAVMRTEGTVAEYQAIIDTVKYIALNPAENLTESVLAARVFMSRNRFIRLFRSYNGMTPAQYVRTFRVRKSLEMIATGQAGIYEVAMECGFGSMSGFYKAVMSVTGTTPGKLISELSGRECKGTKEK